MTSLAKKYDESRLSARFAMLIGLWMAGTLDGLLRLENLRTSPVALSYALALGALALGTLVFLIRQARGYLSPERPGSAPHAGPVWHGPRLFTDPWYQIPAIYCVFVLLVLLIMDLAAEPPASDRAVWFLVFVAFMCVVLPASISRRVRQEEADREGATDGRHAKATVAEAFRDPWFTVPGVILGAVHVARYGVEAIEEDPSSPAATWLFLAPLLAIAAATVMPSIDRLRRRRKARSRAANVRPAEVSGELLPSESEPQ